MRQYLENGRRIRPELLLMTNILHMGFRLTLDDLELDGGRLPLFSSFIYINQHNSSCIQHTDTTLGSMVGFSGSADLTAILDIQNGHNVTTGSIIDVMFDSRVGFPAELRFLLWWRSIILALLSHVTLASARLSCYVKHGYNCRGQTFKSAR